MFRGIYTALITPFNENGTIDETTLISLIDKQLDALVDGIVIQGTTGESPTINSKEHEKLVTTSIQHINGRCKVIIGTGSNSTFETIERSLQAQQAGADGLLIVNPYYNKPTQKGLLAHFTAVADAVEIPILLYNILGRTSVNLETTTLLQLAQHKNIVGVKEASGSITQIKEVISSIPSNFLVLSGDDNLTKEIMQLGGHGVVSVLGNIIPSEMKKLVTSCRNKNWETAQTIHNSLEKLFKATFIETNPQPIKTLMANENICQEIFRLPLTTMEDENKFRLLQIWNQWKTNNN